MQFLSSSTSTISEKNIAELCVSLQNYLEKLRLIVAEGTYTHNESSLNLPTDDALLNEVLRTVTEKKHPALKYIIVIGIGGSNLGTKAVYDALRGSFDLFLPTLFPKLIFADTVDSDYMERMVHFLKNSLAQKEEVLINIISKSGGTTETIANTEVLLSLLEKKWGPLWDRIVVTTDYESKLWHVAKNKGASTLSIPAKVGGRYSVLSAVGLFPLALAGFDVTALRQGAADMRTRCLASASELAALSAALIVHLFQKGMVINDTFVFHPELESLGKWYRQLMGESIGKEKNIHGDTVHTGPTPTVSVGSTDLHSVGQLYLGGPKNKFTCFVSSQKTKSFQLPTKLHFSDVISGLEGKTLADLMNAILSGVKIAYAHNELPFVEILLDDLSEYSIGEYLQFKMIEIMCAGYLLEVNAFDQPNVESYKIETKRILQNEK